MSTDERERAESAEFEKWAAEAGQVLSRRDYCWQAWKARAALAATPTPAQAGEPLAFGWANTRPGTGHKLMMVRLYADADDPLAIPLYAAAAAQAAQPLTELQRMKIIGEEFPIALVQPIVIAKVDSVCLAIERAHGIGATQTPRPNEPELGADGGAQGKEER